MKPKKYKKLLPLWSRAATLLDGPLFSVSSSGFSGFILPNIKQPYPVLHSASLVHTQPMRLKAGWIIESQKDIMCMHGMTPIKDCDIPKWLKKADSRRGDIYKIPDARPLGIDGIVALGDNGRLQPSSDPNNKDVWFIFASEYKEEIFIYNGSMAIPCVLSDSMDKPGYEEIWINTRMVILLSNAIRFPLDELINEYLDNL